MPEPLRRTEPLRILIVEDETIVGMGLRAQLSKLGHSVVGHAANAAEARLLYLDKQPDLVFMDIRLGESDGLELATELLKERRCPMIVLSAYSDQQLINRAGDAGFFGYLIKPAGPEALSAQIEVSLQRFQDQERLRMEKDHLAQTLETRKLVEKAKGLLMEKRNLSEADAFRAMQKMSRDRCQNMKITAQEIIKASEIF